MTKEKSSERNDIDLDDMRSLLAAEKDQLEEELESRGRKAQGNDWQGASAELKTSFADQTEIADQIEELATNVPLVEELEKRYREVNAALERIEKGTYGICEVSHEPIPKDRLEADPAARTKIEFAE